MASAASGPKLLGSVPHCRTKSWLAFEVQAILAELALANSSIGFSTCVLVWLVVGVPGVWANPKPAQNTRTAAIFKRFFIPFSPPESTTTVAYYMRSKEKMRGCLKGSPESPSSRLIAVIGKTGTHHSLTLMTLIRKGLGALKKPLKRRGTEEAEERGKLPELPRLPNIAENRKGKPFPLLDTDNTDRGIGNPDLRFKGASDHGDHPIMRDYPLLSLSSA